MTVLHQITQGPVTLFHDTVHWPEITEEHFDAGYWQQRGDITGKIATGRGTTWFFQVDGQEYVLKRYHRGGRIAVMLGDKYVYSGFAKTRSWREWELLNTLNDWRLPTPRAVAGRVTRHGMFYTADLIMTRILDATPLSVLLTQNPLDENIWRCVGQTLRNFHQHQAFHADLTANNILLGDTGQVWLLDFDLGAIKTSGNGWKQSNLKRLQRSFNKMKRNKPVFFWDEQNWEMLISGYQDAA